MEAQQLLLEFDRWFAALCREREWSDREAEAKQERVFLDWLDKHVGLDAPARPAILAAFDERESARAAEQRVLEERREQQRDYLFNRWLACVGDAQISAFITWFEERAGDFGHDDEKAYDLWQQQEDARRDASRAEAARQESAKRAQLDAESQRKEVADVAARERQEAAVAAAREREAAEQQARADERGELAARLADPTWLKGEDPDAWRALVAWRRVSGKDLRFEVTDAALRATVMHADAELMTTLDQRQREVEAAREQHRRERVVRKARGQPPVEIPEELTAYELVDADAVARWLVAHDGAYELVAGRWYDDERRDPETGKVTVNRELAEPSLWFDIVRRCERWAVWHRVEQLVAEYPETGERLRDQGTRLLADQPAPDLNEELADAHDAWSVKPADDRADLAGTATREPRSKRRAAREPETMFKAIKAFIKAYPGRHGGRAPSTRAILDGVKGRTGEKQATLKEMVEAGEVVKLTAVGASGGGFEYHVAEE